MKQQNLQKSIFIILSIVIIYSCNDDTDTVNYYNLNQLPVDTGGVHEAIPLETSDAPFGYYAYLPSGYDAIEETFYPVLIFLHGSGEKGNSATNQEVLDLVLRNGPPDMIEKGSWNPIYPMLVFSPQCHDGNWQPDKLKLFLDYIVEHYKVNTRRIYLTGLSMGGYGSFSYVGTYGDNSYVAAVVPICGGGNVNQASNFVNIPLWAFHGEDDSTVLPEKSIDMVEVINTAGPMVNARITLFPGIGHNSWDYTYEGIGMGKESPEYDPFDKTIYSWMFQYQRFDLDSLMNHY